MNFQPVSIGFGAMLMLAMIAVNAEPAVPQAASSDICALLKPDDLTTLLGSKPVANPNKGSCSWTISGSPKKLVAAKYAETGTAAEMAFSVSRKKAAKSGSIIVIANLGERAFAKLTSFGVVLMIIDHGKLLQLLYSAGAEGTQKDLDTLQPVAMKAIAAL